MAITYCIVCNITGEKYYGSTVTTLSRRMSSHKCNKDCCAKTIIERGDYDVYILGEYETKQEAKIKENWYIINKECINKNRVKITYEESIERQREYYNKNRVSINNKMKEHYYKIREKNKLYRKEYYKKNREKILLQSKETYKEKKLIKSL